jgi:preprotein translocase subunit SecA
VTLTEEGVLDPRSCCRAGAARQVDNLYDPVNTWSPSTILQQALRAHTPLQERHYVVYMVDRGTREVVIIDEFTGRARWPAGAGPTGLHQAVEAKERVPIQNENQTLATITFQNFFKLYQTSSSGMTGTADTEATSS